MNTEQKQALIVIDIQNDYFPGGSFPLWNTEKTLSNIKDAIKKAQKRDIPIIIVQHVANKEAGISPFFNEGTRGVKIHKELLDLAPNGIIVKKEFADSFEQTNLEDILIRFNINEIIICGMMTQNCVTHTSISKKAEKYQTSILVDCCTTVDEMIHNIALHALSTRVKLLTTEQAL